MKSLRKMLLLLLVLLLIPMMVACSDDDDDDDDEKESDEFEFTVERGENSPKGVVISVLEYSDSLEKGMEDVTSTFYMFSNEKALKKMDMDSDEDDDTSVTWKVTKSAEYDEDADVTAGVKAYVRMQAGDSSAVEHTALVEVTISITTGDEKEKVKTYYTLAKIGGTWYLVSDNAIAKDSIDDAVEYWRDKAGR